MSKPAIDPQKTNAGIAVDPHTLERVVPESKRADGSVRKQLKIRPGFTPQEDVSRFRGSRQAQMDANTLPKGHIIGWVAPSAAASKEGQGSKPMSKSAKKNAKRKEKREEKKNEIIKDSWEDDDDDASPPPKKAQPKSASTPSNEAQTVDASNSADTSDPKTSSTSQTDASKPDADSLYKDMGKLKVQ
ncbi:hypothetical protein K435DRAFT_959168 [Dendrothele bispora CBS 962.96]|uniref:WIBG Mago-binding domain-containing protein n=1 Tax=Dendrothele bispora (strain CBS 962.96) TaxID=1314807 RepID=A0A4S8N0N3_DENBC|nr:hypothetical protein K435DRAFT_959168 [Dendrothele bispora CBS 962.96]